VRSSLSPEAFSCSMNVLQQQQQQQQQARAAAARLTTFQ
jgi:hypothetical protein